jgi:hypothetical protein
MGTRTPSKTTLIPAGCDPPRDSPWNALSDGFVLYVRRSKIDQAGKGKAIHFGSAAATCPVSAIDDWATFAKYRKGRLFPAMSVHGRPPFWGSDP